MTSSLNIEDCLKTWREQIFQQKRKELSPGELSAMFQKPILQNAFFRIIDRDCNGAISEEEWTGCFLKLLGDTEVQLMNWFVEKFTVYCNTNETSFLKQDDFAAVVSDVEFGYRFASLISPRSRRVNTIQLASSLEIIASMSTDAKWLSWLKYQFTEAMNKNDRACNNELHVTLNDFTQNFYFKAPFLAHRLFNYLDKDKSGYLSLHEFINGLEVVVNGTKEQKMEFLFKVFDVDGNGRIDFNELRMMLKCCLEETPSLDLTETVDDLSAALFKDTDKDDSGDISFEELKEAFQRHHGLFKSLTVSTSIWIKPKFINRSRKYNLLNRAKHLVENKRSLIVFWSLYSFIHLACMVSAYFSYSGDGIWIIIARMFGNSLNFNCALILVLVLRKHFTWLRTKGASSLLPLDEFIEIHKIIGVVILVETLIHTGAHLIKLYYVTVENNLNYFTCLFTGVKNIGYPTGIFELLLLVVILLFAMPYVREKGYFQLFYWFHMLTIPWLLIMLSHGRKFWIWLLIPGFCYAVEKILRYRKVRSNKFGDTFITEAFVLPSKVTHLVIRKPSKFHFKPGDYVFINIPIIAKHEWHPFSISSAPEVSDYIWLHVRAVGNWTKKLYAHSMSSKFDVSATSTHATGQRSNVRINMRSRMSKYLSEANFNGKHEPVMVDTLPPVVSGNQLHKKGVSFCKNGRLNELMNNVVEEEKKEDMQARKNTFNRMLEAPVQAENNEELLSIVPTNQASAEVKFGLNQSQNLPTGTIASSDSGAQSMGAAPLRHKGILKVMMLGNNNNGGSKASSFNETINNGAQHDFPTQSTPKTLSSNSKIDTTTNNQLEVIQNVNQASPKLNKRQRSKSSDFLDKESDTAAALGAHAKLSQMKSLDLETIPASYQPDKLNWYEQQAKAEKSIDKKSVDYYLFGNNPVSDVSKNNLMMNENSKDGNVMIDLNEHGLPKNADEVVVVFNNKDDDDDDDIPHPADTSDVKPIVRRPSVLSKNRTIASLTKSVSFLHSKFIRGGGAGTVAQAATEKAADKDDILGYMKMYQRTNRVNMDTIGLDQLWRLKIFIDGPYGTPSYQIFDAEHAVLIAAGIGITPFSSILQSLMHRYRQARASCPNCNYKLGHEFFCNGTQQLTVRKVDFIWVTREQRSLEWFISMLSQMEIEQRKNDGESFLDTHLYVTSARRQSDLKSIGLHLTLDAIFSQEESSLIEGLRQRTHYGRPNWDIVMQSLIRKQRGKINVFYCGLPSLANVLQNKCKEYDLIFKKEIF